MVALEDFLDTMTTAGERIAGEAPSLDRIEEVPLALECVVFDVSGGVDKDGERALCGEVGVELFEGASGGVARVGKGFESEVELFFVEGFKAIAGHIGFAPDFEDGGDGRCVGGGEQVGGRALEAEGERLDGAEIGGDIFARHAIATGGADRKQAFFVEQRDGDTIDLGFSDVFDGRIGGEAQMAFDALVEVEEFLFVHGVGEGEHGDAVVDFLEVFESGAADALGGGVGEAKIGEIFFEGFELAKESVIFGI